MPDRAYMALSPAERLVTYLKASGIVLVRDVRGTLCILPPLDTSIDMEMVMQALAAYGPELATLMEVT